MGKWETHCDSEFCTGYRKGYIRHNGDKAWYEMTDQDRGELQHDLAAMRKPKEEKGAPLTGKELAQVITESNLTSAQQRNVKHYLRENKGKLS